MPDPHDDFSVTVRSDRSSYRAGELVDFAIEVCNEGAATTTEGGGGREVPFSFEVVDDRGHVVADDTHAVYTLELIVVPWMEGQCRTERAVWNQRYWNRPGDEPDSDGPAGVPVEGERVPPGDYRVEVSTRQGPATSEPFTIQR